MERAKELRKQLRINLPLDGYDGPELSVVMMLRDAALDLQRVLELIPEDELLKFLSLFTGEGTSSTFHEIVKRIPIEGKNRERIHISDEYVPSFIQGELQSIPIDDSTDPSGSLRDFFKRNLPDDVGLSHWQIRRGFCYYIAGINLIAAKNYIESKKFNQALIHIAEALKQIGAASVRSIDEIEQAAIRKGEASISKKGAKAKARKLEPAREYAVELANKKSYPSRRQAVLAIKEDVLKYANNLEGVSMSADQAETTIDGWLKNSGYTPSASKQGMSAGEHPTSAG